MGSPRFFYGWVVVAVAFVTQFIAVGCIFYGFSVMLPVLADTFSDGLRTPIMAAQVYMSLTGMLIAPVIGRLVGAGWLRSIMTSAVICTGAALILLSRAEALWQIQVLFATLLSFGANALTALTGTPLVVNWFEARRGVALGVSQLGASVGGAVMAPVVAALIESVGWRGAYETLGIAVLCVAPFVFLLVVDRPEARGLRPDGAPAEDAADPVPGYGAGAPAFSTRAALREPNLWLIAGATGIVFMVTSALIMNIVAFGTDAGFSPGRAALLASLLSGGAALGKLVFGQLCDRIGESNAFLTSIGGMALGLLIMLQLEGYAATMVCALLMGVALGGALPVSSALIARAFGRDRVGPMLGLTMPIIGVLQLGGPLFAAWSRDQSGSYQLSFWAFIVSLSVAALLVRQLRLPSDELPPV